MATKCQEPLLSIPQRRVLNDWDRRNRRFISAIWREFPARAPESYHAERARLARKAEWEKRQVAIAREVPFAHCGTLSLSVITSVAQELGLRAGELVGKGRTREVIRARHLAMRLLRDLTFADGSPRFSTTQIGGFFGRDHSTVLHALQTIDDKMGRHAALREVYQALKGRTA